MLGVQQDQADKRQFDGLALRNRKPGMTYRFSRKDDFQVSLNRFNGYEIVDRTEDNVESVLNSGTRMKKGSDVDNTITLGDMILMSMPTEQYEARRRREEQTALARQIAVTKAYHSEVTRIAGPGVSYESGHHVGMGRTGSFDSEEQRANAADRSSQRDKMSGSMAEGDYDRMMAELEAQRGGKS